MKWPLVDQGPEQVGNLEVESEASGGRKRTKGSYQKPPGPDQRLLPGPGAEEGLHRRTVSLWRVG